MKMLSQKVLVHLRDIQEPSCLAMLAALQAYFVDANKKTEAFYSTMKIDARMSTRMTLLRDIDLSRFDFIWSNCLPKDTVITEDASVYDSDFDAIFSLDEQTARNIVSPTRRHLHQGFGIMLGSEPTSLPDVSNLVSSFSVGDTTLVHPLLRNRVSKIFPDMLLRLSRIGSLEERTAKVFASSGVVDYTGYETYLASCLKLPVLEVSMDDQLTKWSNPNYIRMTDVTTDGFIKGMSICHQLISQQAQMRMGAGTSAVHSAAVSSPQSPLLQE